MMKIIVAALLFLASEAAHAQRNIPGPQGPAGPAGPAGFPSSGTAVAAPITGDGTGTTPLGISATAFFPSTGARVGSGLSGKGTATDPLTASGGGGGGFPSTGAAVGDGITGDGTGTLPLTLSINQYNDGLRGDGTSAGNSKLWKTGYGDNNVNNSTHGDTYPCYIGGGYGNNCQHEGSTINGGRSNTVTENYATILGGYNNTAYYFSVVGGGDSNVGTGLYSVSIGGILNHALGDHSIALGTKAYAIHTGAFVYNADPTQVEYDSTADQQASFNVAGGFRITVGAAETKWDGSGNAKFPAVLAVGAADSFILKDSTGGGCHTIKVSAGGAITASSVTCP